MSIWIALTKDFHTRISPEDADALSAFSWCADVRVLAIGVEQVYAVRYVRRSRRTCKLYMHREIVRPPCGYLVDHLSGDSLDNRRENLRLATFSDNRNNTAPTGWTSNYRGVSRDRCSWRARLSRLDPITGKREILLQKNFDMEIEAARAYDLACLEHIGPFARLNFPLETYQPKRAVSVPEIPF